MTRCRVWQRVASLLPFFALQRGGFGERQRAPAGAVTAGVAPTFPIPGTDGPNVLTPDDIMAGVMPEGPVLVYDDDHYYMGGVIAELLIAAGREVRLATPMAIASAFTVNTLEQGFIQTRLLQSGVDLVTSHKLISIAQDRATLACVYTNRPRELSAASVVMVTSRRPVDDLWQALAADPDRLAATGIRTLRRIGDCHGPSTIAAAVWEGHRFARELGETITEIPYRREIVELSSDFRLP